ncbi:lysosomal-trafficking regulator mauve isoform 2-T7 [Glossina fuscipes fuscipes]
MEDPNKTYNNDEYQSLLHTLKIIWQNYTHVLNDAETKQHWLQLFLYNFQFVCSELEENDDFKSFFKPIPEEICSYLLEQIYEIISTSELYTPALLDAGELEKAAQPHKTTSEKNTTFLQLIKKNHNFAQLILRQPSDCSKILALRNFLTHQLGHHILKFLLRIDVKLVVSQKSLCNLCINLFPNCSWSQECKNLSFSENIYAYVGNLNFYQKTKTKPSTPRTSRSFESENISHVTVKTNHHNYAWDLKGNEPTHDFDEFLRMQKTSDEIAILLIQVVKKCTSLEYGVNAILNSEHSVSMMALNFSLDCLRMESDAFSSYSNAEHIKCQLLQLNEQCFNNIFFISQQRVPDLQFQCVFAKLVAALEINMEHSKLLYALLFIIFGCLHNVVTIFGYVYSKQNLYHLKFVDENMVDRCMNAIDHLLKNYPPLQEDVKSLFTTIFRTLLRIIDYLSKYDQLLISNAGAVLSSAAHIKPPRHRKLKGRQVHCHQHMSPRLSCYFQGMLMGLLTSLPLDLQEHSMLYLAKCGTCCCHYTLAHYYDVFKVILVLSPYHQKCAYKFLAYKILNTVLGRSSVNDYMTNSSSSRKSNLSNCAKCGVKLKSLEFHDGLLELYLKFYKQIREPENNWHLLLFLKHLKHISYLLTNDIASGILASIVLPVFRENKQRLNDNKTPQSGKMFWPRSQPTTPVADTAKSLLKLNTKLTEDPIKLLTECLNIFAMYLRDIRLIKAFYNEENIQHLEDLLEEPPLIRGVCDLIKIGIDNITFLGDNSQEQPVLSRRLITLQLNSSNRANHLFTALIAQIVKTNKRQSSYFWLEATLNHNSKYSKYNAVNPLSALDILHIVALQWCLNFELLKTSQYFYNEFAKIYSIVMDDDDDNNDGDGDGRHDDDDDDDDDDEDGNVHKACAGIRSKHEYTNAGTSLKRGDKTIIDILRLNYNALSAFLMVPTTKLKKSQPVNSKTTNNADSCLTNSVENLLFTLTTAPPAAATLTEPLFSTSSTTDTRTHASNYYHSLFDNSISNSISQSQPSFLHKLLKAKQKDCILLGNESKENIILVFDIKNQSEFFLNAFPDERALRAVEKSVNHLRATYDCSNRSTYENANPDKVYRNTNSGQESVFIKIFQIFGSLFGTSRTNSLNDLSKPYQSATIEGKQPSEVDNELLCLYESHTDCKRLLLKLFETTMAICIKGYQNEEVDKMHKHLRKLKTLILNRANNNWEQYGEEHSRENLVLQALQTLLRIAELSNTENEPAAVINPSIVTTVTDEVNNLRDVPTPSCSRSIKCPRLKEPNAVSYNYHQLPIGLPSKNSCLTPSTPPQRPLSGKSDDNDYFSTRASLICADSELELSENEPDDFYLTADEGYDADAEIPEVSETEGGVSDGGAGGGGGAGGAGGGGGGGGGGTTDLWHPFQPSSRYRTHMLHEGICCLVIDILIELSEKCCLNPTGWCENLAQLMNRLFVIRDYLGGPLVMLKGFGPILQCNDARLRELQQSILELVVDLNTPDVLQIFFSILASKNPPIDILINYMNYICANTLKRAHPSVELEFPVNIEIAKYTSTGDLGRVEQIERLRRYHLQCQANTPFTRSPYIIPITHARLWNPEGFTISLWLNVKGSQNAKSSCQTVDDDTRSSSDVYMRTHILSMGTNQVMLSIYLNNSMHLVFETSKPNAELIMANKTQTEESPQESNYQKVSSGTLNGGDNSASSIKSINKNQTANVNTFIIASPTSSSPLTKAFKQTKLVLLNSFSNMHLFNGHSESETFFESSHFDLKHYRVSKNKWIHLTVAVQMHNDSLDLIVYVDGLEHHLITLPFRNLRLLTRNHTFQIVSLGDGCVNKTNNNTANSSESHSTLELNNPMRFSISNLMLFKRCISTKEAIINLTAMGPDFTELTQCHVANLKPNYGYLNLSKMQKPNYGNFMEAMKILRENRILHYTAQQPDIIMGYDSNMELDNTTYGRPYGLLLYGEILQNHLPSLQTAVILCGGLSNLLYMFARVVEKASNSSTQAMALDLLLNVAFSESQLYTEFQRNDYISLIGYVIKTERCSKDCQLLKGIINNACSQPLISKKGDHLIVNETTIATVVYPRLLVAQLHRYSDWHRSGSENSDVLDMLLIAILALTREKHPQRDFNIEQFQIAGLMKELLNLCKVYVIESPNPVFISKRAADSFVSIISVFAGSPPPPSLLDEIMKLLLLLHKPSECYITHDRSKFYFLLTGEVPTKEKSSLVQATHFGRVAAPFKRGVVKRSHPGVAKLSVDTTTTTHVTHASNTPPMDKARRARLERLRKLHKSNSSYKKALHDFEENLENVADCSKLNKNALQLLSPEEVAKWREKFKRCTSMTLIASPMKERGGRGSKTFRMSSSSTSFLKHSPLSQRIQRKRLRLSSGSSARSLISAGKEKYFRTNSRKSESSLYSLTTTTNTSNLDYSENIMTAYSDGSSCSKTSSQPRRVRLLTKTDSYNSTGIAALQSGLLLLLKDFLCLLPDNSIDDVLHHYIKVEFLLVLANHSSTSVRSAILKLMGALVQRLPSQDLQLCFKNLYCHHLANQLTIYPIDMGNFETCLEWVTGQLCNLQSFLICDTRLHIEQRFALNALLAITSKATMAINSSADFNDKCFIILRNLYAMNVEEQSNMVEAGLIQCAVKALHYLYAKNNTNNQKTEDSIANLLTTIGEFSLKSAGHINILWDIINMLAFYQEKQIVSVMNGFRAIQAKLQLNWIHMFFAKTDVSWNYKVIQLTNCSLSTSETKTRFELLINRSAQFFTVSNERSSPSPHEIELFELLVSYSIATNQRCNNFIAWGLQPSQPRDLRCFIIDALWISCQDDFLPTIICDGKMIKALLWLSLLEDLETPIQNLAPLCRRLGINENDSTWNLENEIQRLELQNCADTAKQKAALEKTVFKFENLAQNCIESSMLTTRRVAELQNSERKLLMNYMKDYDDTHTYTKWLDIVRRMTHEGAPWYNSYSAENSWELDDTEGPSRVHTRLRRCHLDLDKRFFMSSYHEPNSTDSSTTPSHYTRPLDYLIASYDQQLNISLNSQILYNFPAKYLPVDGEIDGEIIVTDHKLYFLATYRCKYFYVNCDIANITEIWLKRHQHQEKAFEIFLDTNQSLFFSLQNCEDWKIMRDVFCDKIVVPPDQSKLLLITQQWREGLLTNWEYLMSLNQISGRTYNDLMQYPIFPWILSNYTGDVLNLNDATNFRKLPKPIAVQNEENEQHYINNYTYIKNTMTNMGSIILKPYHYSSHYSNSGTVLHFLVRVPPFTSYFLRYQDNNFDIPDRTFHALSTTWSLASRDSPTDVKELIPEFFCLPEMFENFERFDFGCRQNGERVENVSLPPWSLKDSRLFVLIHRQALESELVRNNLHHWIDLIFGYKQTGEAAIEAINVFHPATYAVFLESEINDPIEREAVETMVKTYGQMPRQLFKTSHPPSKSLTYQFTVDKPILSSVRGLRWGVYVGSPQLSKPFLGNIHKLPGAEYLLSFNNTNVVYGLPSRSCVMQGAESDTFNVISWGYDDRIVRIQPLNKIFSKPKNLLYNSAFDDITACGCDCNSNQLWFGHKSGRLSIYKCTSVEANAKLGKSRQSYVRGLRLSYNSAFRKITSKSNEMEGSEINSANMMISAATMSPHDSPLQKDGADLQWSGPTVLVRHTDEITCIALSVEFKIVVTAGKDGIAVIWDLNNLSYVRTIERPAEIHHSPITLLCTSPTLGDIVTVHTLTSLNSPTIPKSATMDNCPERVNSPSLADECFEVTEENLDDFVNVSVNPNGKSILRLHSANARYVQHIVHEDLILAACYSFVKEGVGVNVIATAIEGGIIRLWSSWNLNFITEIITGMANISSIIYSTHQHLVVLTKESHIQVWETDGLCGNSPKFPQIAYK